MGRGIQGFRVYFVLLFGNRSAKTNHDGERAVLADHPKPNKALLMHTLVSFLATNLGCAVSQVQAVLKLDLDDAEAEIACSRFGSVMSSKQERNTRLQNGDSTGAIEKSISVIEVSF